MESGDEPMELKEARAAYFARWEAVEIFKAHELAAITEEQAMRKILTLRLFAPAPPKMFNGEGLIEQQAIFQRSK